MATTLAMPVSGLTYTVQNAKMAYSLTSPTAGTLRFEVRTGDVWSGDPATKNRSEIAGWTTYGLDTQVNVAYGFLLEPGAANTAAWVAVGQFHQVVADSNSPPFTVGLIGDKMVIGIEFNDASGKIVYSPLYQDAQNITRGHTYNMQIQATFDTNNHGHLVVVRDGVTLVNYVGSFGYVGMGGVYWKEGIYRSAAVGTLAADFSGLTVTASAANLTLKPNAPSVSFTQTLGTDSGASSTDFISKNGYVVLSGAATAGSMITVKDGSTVLGSAQANGLGVWTFSANLGEGSHTLAASASLSGLTTTYTGTPSIVVDTVKPGQAVVSGVSAGAGLIGNGGLATSTRLIISGTAEAKSIVQVFVDGGKIGSAITDATGHWSFDNTATPMTVGSHWLSAAASDLAGNSGSWSQALILTVTNTAPSVSFTQKLGSDSGASGGDFTTNNGFVKLSGTAVIGSSITIKDGATILGSTKADGAGAWTFSASLGQGTHTLTALSTIGGLTTSYTSPQPIVVDLTAPNAPSVTGISPNNGIYNSSDTANTGKLIISGSGAINSIIQVYADGVLAGQTSTDSTGHWTFDDRSHTFADGYHWFAAVASDLAGNHSGWSSPLNVLVDTVTPTNSISSVDQTATTFSLSGWAQAGGKVTLSDGAVTMATVAVSSSGAWNATINEAQSSVHTYLMTTSDAAGNFASPMHIVAGTDGADILWAESAGDLLWGGGGDDIFILDASKTNGTSIGFFRIGHDQIDFKGFNAATAQVSQVDTTHWLVSDGIHSATFQISNAPIIHSSDYYFG